MRGKAGFLPASSFLTGITPAYAGKSPGDENRQDAARDHPRVCGEKKIANSDELAVEGSPPRMRGKVLKNRVKSGQPRITPAYAGKRTDDKRRKILCQDHPRVCGEKPTVPAVGTFLAGSPPRMRGKVDYLPDSFRRTRITPAYAGKSAIQAGDFLRNWDHPRVCGEKRVCTSVRGTSLGSPPRMRGKANEWHIQQHLAGITPAYAGKRFQSFGRYRAEQDHPRVCGEKCRGRIRIHHEQGSPPRMRGKGFTNLAFTDNDRITPAYAGKRLKRSRSTVPPVAIVPLFPSVCNKPVVSDGSPAGRDAPLFLPAENAVPASPAYNLRSL